METETDGWSRVLRGVLEIAFLVLAVGVPYLTLLTG
jgi:hypothetical protein